jgi:hypothetical protein
MSVSLSAGVTGSGNVAITDPAALLAILEVDGQPPVVVDPPPVVVEPPPVVVDPPPVEPPVVVDPPAVIVVPAPVAIPAAPAGFTWHLVCKAN